MALLLASGAACGHSTPERAPRPIATADPVLAFAPLVRLHARERLLPTSAQRFLRHSTLEWSGGPCGLEANIAAGPVSRRTTGEGAPPLDAARLGGERAYRHRPRGADCVSRRSNVYATTQSTRPFEEDGRPPGLHADEGFSLDLLAAAHGGDRRNVRRSAAGARLTGVPTYAKREAAQVQGRPGLRLSYWMLYGRNEPTAHPGEDPLDGREGDWERIDVVVRQAGGPARYLPASVTYWQDGQPRRVPWESLRLAPGPGGQRTHPLTYAALGSHTPYPRPGRHRRTTPSPYGDGTSVAIEETSGCRECPAWATWKLVRDLRREPWYGYGGGWGARGLSDQGSGPLGPLSRRVG